MPAHFQWLDKGIWVSLPRLARASRRRDIAVAYLSSDSHIRLKKGDRLIVNASRAAIASGQTSARALASAIRAGAEIYSQEYLHAKVYVFDAQVVIGSANLSANSRNLKEVCIQTGDRAALRMARKWFEDLRRQSTRLTGSAIRELARIPVVRRGGAPARKPTLLNAFEDQLPVLEDLVFGVYTTDAEASSRSVRQAAKRQGVTLPHDTSAWTWFEDPYSRAAEKQTRKLLGSRLMVALWATADDDKVIGVKGVDKQVYSFIDCYRIGSTLVSVFDQRKRPPVALRDLKEFRNRLNHGLATSPRIARRLNSAECALVRASTLADILR